MRLTLIISSLQCGGAERVMTTMANYWARRGEEITLLTLDDRSKPFYRLDEEVRHISLGVACSSANVAKGFSNNLKRIRSLRREIHHSRPDAVISFMDKTNVITLIATRGLGLPVIVSERTDPAMYQIGRIWNLLRELTYWSADCLVVQSKYMRSYFSSEVQARAWVIPNPVLRPQALENSSAINLAKPTIVAMGRLERLKGFDLLLHSFARLSDRFGDWNLAILGEGPLRPELESLSNELGLAERVVMPGRVQNPHAILSQADLFVMSSRFEGFPNALCEAMACGLPVISTNCPTGPADIIRDGTDGLLVSRENVEALSTAMERLMSSEDERKRLACNATDVITRFGLEKVMKMWTDLLCEVISERRGNVVRAAKPTSPTFLNNN